MKLLICAGGTGGGVYPALAVHNALAAHPSPVETLWVGGEGGMEEDLVKRAGLPFEAIPAAGVHGIGLRTLPGNSLRLARGLAASRRILKRFKPEALFFTGGYVAVPMALAARLPGLHPRPHSVLFVPDIEPGWALKVLAQFADQIAISADESRQFLPGRVPATLTGYPLRPDLADWQPRAARQALGLATDLPVLLVNGGSKGARSINRAVLSNLATLLPEMEIIHISGQLDWAEIETARGALPSDLVEHYHPHPYLHEIGAAFTVADLVISRAGASTLGEYPLFGLPAILVPYPYAWRYQKVNADFLAKQEAAVVIDNQQLGERLLPVVRDLMSNPQKRAQMRQAMRGLHRPQAAKAIADLLYRTGQGGA